MKTRRIAALEHEYALLGIFLFRSAAIRPMIDLHIPKLVYDDYWASGPNP
jgi:hypothetical protein